MNYDVVRLLRLWAGWVCAALAHQLARLGNLVAGTDEQLVEPQRPGMHLVDDVLMCTCTPTMRAAHRRCEACVWDDEHPPRPTLRLTRSDEEIVQRLIDTEMRP